VKPCEKTWLTYSPERAQYFVFRPFRAGFISISVLTGLHPVLIYFALSGLSILIQMTLGFTLDYFAKQEWPLAQACLARENVAWILGLKPH